MKKKIIAVIIGVIVLVVLGVAAVSAYLIDAETVINQTVVGGNTIEIVEDFDPPEEVKPGTVITKDVKINNLGPNDCYVRIRALFSNSDMAKYCTVNWNTTDFIYDAQNGYYYYPAVLTVGAVTPSLFTTITVSSDIPENEIKEFRVIVYAESYQSEGFATYQAAWEHAGRNDS
jgi:hypothetical protein